MTSLVEALDLQGRIACSKCFTYQTSKYRLVFMHEDLNEDERCIVLAHEEGHIWNRHFSEKRIFGNDIIQEYEANEFVHYLLAERRVSRQWNQLTAAIRTRIMLNQRRKQNHFKFNKGKTYKV